MAQLAQPRPCWLVSGQERMYLHAAWCRIEPAPAAEGEGWDAVEIHIEPEQAPLHWESFVTEHWWEIVRLAYPVDVHGQIRREEISGCFTSPYSARFDYGA
ncbi:MAG: hypothetical protein HUU35_11740 [Armatimonadetes bacterium]|nr:hypothetical protein [Armatimonadota bacterium]